MYRKNSDAYQKLRREKPAKFMENGKCVKINLFHILKVGFKKKLKFIKRVHVGKNLSTKANK